MTYFEHKLRLFCTTKEDTPCKVSLPHKRSEGRLKTYTSAIDLRSWHLKDEERRKHLLDLINRSPKSEVTQWKYVTLCAILPQISSFHERKVSNLQNMINDLTYIVKTAIPYLSGSAMKEIHEMIEKFCVTYSNCMRYFAEPIDIGSFLCEPKGDKSLSDVSEGSTGFLNQTVEEDIKTFELCKEMAEYEGWNKMSSEDRPPSISSEEEMFGDAPAKGEPEELQKTEEKLKDLQEESKADKEKIVELEQLLYAANSKIKALTDEKNALKVKLSQHERTCITGPTEEEALKKIYIIENRRMREELEGLEQMCWRVKQVLQWVIKERDCYRRRCIKLEYLASEIDDLKCEMEAWRYTEQERCRLEKVVQHLKRVLQEQDHQLRHLLSHIELMSQRDRECRSKSCNQLQCPSRHPIRRSSRHNELLCLPPPPTEELNMASQESTEPLALERCRKKGKRHRHDSINTLFIKAPTGENLVFIE